jgi:hypothetical protein
MKVGDLIKELSGLDPEAPVFCYCDDEDAPHPVLQIEDVLAVKGETSRGKDNLPQFTFIDGSYSMGYVMLHVTADD